MCQRFVQGSIMSSDRAGSMPLEMRTVSHVLEANATTNPDKVAVIEAEGRSLTYRELDAEARRIARGFAELGVVRGDRVLVLMPDVAEFVLLWCGLSIHGAVEVPVNRAYKGAILARICNDSQAQIIVVAAEFIDRLEEIAGELTHLNHCVVYSTTDATFGHETSPQRLASRCRMTAYVALFGNSTPGPGPAPAFNDLMALMFTSGTTGNSKGVMVTHAHAYACAVQCSKCFDVSPASVLYTAGLPLFHCAGQWEITYAAFIHHATVVIRNGYKNAHFWADVRQHGCTATTLLGAVGTFLWKQPPTPLDRDHSLRTALFAPILANHREFTERFGVRVASAYGSTELPCVSVLRPGDAVPERTCTGSVESAYEVRILDDADRELPCGELGEICVRPREPWSMLTGYWNQPGYSARAFRNLWYHTGDAGYLDALGRLYFVDRLTDSMRRRGENVSATEVEQEILQHPNVLECAVYPVPDEYTEQEIMASVVARTGERLDLLSLVQHVDARLPYFMVPRYWNLLPELPKTPTGKPQKGSLRAIGVTATTWDRVKAGIKLTR